MRIARLVTAAVIAAAAAVVSTGSPALAHNSLTKAVPAKNATVKEAPAKVELSFLQKVDATQLTIEVLDAQEQKVPSDAPEADGKKGVLALTGDLANGTYTVKYSVVSEDGHPVKGSYKFTVDAPVAPSASAAPAPSEEPVATDGPTSSPATAPATVPAADSSESSGPGAGLIVAIVVAVLVIGGGAVVLARRRRGNPPM
jgi:copper resistance protein C